MSTNLYGLYRAVVQDNVDPEQRYRLRVDAPSLGSTPLPWAEACVPSGQCCGPSIGDSVWIMFEAGDVNNPVWIGVHPKGAV